MRLVRTYVREDSLSRTRYPTHQTGRTAEHQWEKESYEFRPQNLQTAITPVLKFLRVEQPLTSPILPIMEDVAVKLLEIKSRQPLSKLPIS